MRLLTIRLALIFSTALAWPGASQNYPVYNSYLVNPYLYNPAEAASGNMFVFANIRQQWTGIDGAPSISTLNFSSLLDMTRIGVGAKISSHKRGLLKTTDVQFTFAYGLPVNQTDAVYFGISGGLLSKGFDRSKAFDPSDPAIANYLSEKMRPTGSAGVVYKSDKGFNFGLSLPQMLEPVTLSETDLTTTISPFKQVWISAYYKPKVDAKLGGKKSRSKTKKGAFSPLEFYATYKLSSYQTSQAEAIAKLNLSPNFWLSAGYRQQYGLLAGLGLSVDRFLLTYFFEPGSQPDKGFSTGTHEVQAGIKIGGDKRLKRKAPVIHSTLTNTEVTHNPRLQHTVTDPDELEKQKKEAEASTGKRYLVVARVFTDLASADDFKKKLIDQKYNADIYYYAKDKRYYVHIFQTTKAKEATEEIKNLKLYTKLKNIRLVTINEK
jgi:type IX secretion system PorP/SprF family membrane protein